MKGVDYPKLLVLKTQAKLRLIRKEGMIWERSADARTVTDQMPMKISSLYDVGRVFKPCAQPRHLRRTFTIALIVGSWLTLFNQGEVLTSGQLNSVLLLKVFLNYLTPFVVANFGLISAEKTNETTERARPENHCPPGAKKDR